MHDLLHRLLANRYSVIRSQFPEEGRRRWHLRVLQEFWEATLHESERHLETLARPPSDDDFTQDDDPFDSLLEGQELGLLLRTDYSNEDAWQAFCAKLQKSEEELAGAMKPDEPSDDTAPTTNQNDMNAESDSDSESADGLPFPIIKVINPPTTAHSTFNNISNLAALRLLNEVDIRPAPSPPAGEKRIHPPHRLIDQGKWQEIYSGMNIWIYDNQSNIDNCVRFVGQQGDIYGTATGDSWRVQGSHICELQFNLVFLGMTINFGGLDRWDYSERRRNLEEASLALV